MDERERERGNEGCHYYICDWLNKTLKGLFNTKKIRRVFIFLAIQHLNCDYLCNVIEGTDRIVILRNFELCDKGERKHK
jgi:hypothetical protein